MVRHAHLTGVCGVVVAKDDDNVSVLWSEKEREGYAFDHNRDYIETSYVFAPYVPLMTTPTVFAPEEFAPRKGITTRYGKKMIRSDFYKTINVLSGST